MHSAPQDHTAALVRQHALTSKLMGVDFVPAYRLRGSGPVHEPVDAPAHVPDHPSSEAPSTTAPVPAQPSLLPARPAPARGRSRQEAQRLLDALRARYEADAPHRNFVSNFNNIVFGEGDPTARIMFVGEAPGEDEDLSGRPFVGRAGQLLEKMIIAMGLTRQDVYIANVLKTRPPGNRTPTPDEVAACKPYLLEQIAIVAPEAVVALGLSASHALLESTDAMARLRGRWFSLDIPGGLSVPLLPTYHPAFLLRSYTEENRTKVWSDLQQVMSKLGIERRKA